MIVSALRKIESWVVAIAIVANVSGAFVLLTLVAIMNVDIVSRNIFNAPFRGVVEVVIFSLALIVFLQLPDVVRTGRLTRSDGFLGVLRYYTPRFVGIFLIQVHQRLDQVTGIGLLCGKLVCLELVFTREQAHQRAE